MAIEEFTGDFAFLSNFASCKVKFDGHQYPSTEAAYQAAKAIKASDRVPFEKISAGDAKRLGRKVKMRPDWETVKLGIMEDLLRQKFNQEPFKTKLLSTGDQELVEGNWWRDVFWGVYNGRGQNHLGKLLMKIRAELK